MIIVRFTIIAILSTFFQSLCGQCPDRDSVLAELRSGRPDDTTGFQRWLFLEKQLKKCDPADFVVLAKVARRMGILSWYRNDYREAVRYGKKSINLIQQIHTKPKS